MKFQCLITIECPDMDGKDAERILERHLNINNTLIDVLSDAKENGCFPRATAIQCRRYL